MKIYLANESRSAAALLLFVALCGAGAAQPPRHVEGELLVKFKGGPRDASAALARAGMKHEVKRNFDFIGWQHIRLPQGMTGQEGLARYKALPGVLAAEPNYIEQTIDSLTESTSMAAGVSSAPNDPRFSQQWDLPRIGAPDV